MNDYGLFISKCNSRLKLGEKKYGKDGWKKYHFLRLVDELEDEILDSFNYLNFIRKRTSDKIDYNHAAQVEKKIFELWKLIRQFKIIVRK